MSRAKGIESSGSKRAIPGAARQSTPGRINQRDLISEINRRGVGSGFCWVGRRDHVGRRSGGKLRGCGTGNRRGHTLEARARTFSEL